MAEEQRTPTRRTTPLISSVVSSGSGSSTSPISSLQSSGVTAAISVRKIIQLPEVGNVDAVDNDPRAKLSFVEQVKANSMYGSLVHVKTGYELRLKHGPKVLHWFFLVKMLQSDLSYLTIEVTTSDLCDLIPTVRIVGEMEGDAHAVTLESGSASETLTDVGNYQGSLYDLCQIADKVVEDMKSYNLVTSNCQHFCNNLLRKIDRKSYRMTVGREIKMCNCKEAKFDYYDKVMSTEVNV